MSNRPRQLSIDLREYDLPPQWDGVNITWEDYWHPAPPVMICPPPPPEPCKNCARIAPQSTKRGKIPEHTNKLSEWRKHRGKPIREIIRFIAYRRSHCGHDYVEDIHLGQIWDLGDEDYGPRGSYTITDRT